MSHETRSHPPLSPFVFTFYLEYHPGYQLKYQPDSSNRSISLIISLILVIVRTQLLCAAASGLMLRSTSRRDATADNI